MLTTGLLLLATTLVLTPLIQRGIERDARRAAFNRRMRVLAVRLDVFKVTLGLALMPVMRDAVKAAADMQRTMQKLTETMRGPR